MKIVQEVKRFELIGGFSKGDFLELEDTLSCDKQIVKVLDINNDSIKVLKLSTGKEVVYTYNQLTKYEARKMKLVYDDGKNTSDQPTKTVRNLDEEKHEELQDEFQKGLMDILEDIFNSTDTKKNKFV